MSVLGGRGVCGGNSLLGFSTNGSTHSDSCLSRFILHTLQHGPLEIGILEHILLNCISVCAFLRVCVCVCVCGRGKCDV